MKRAFLRGDSHASTPVKRSFVVLLLLLSFVYRHCHSRGKRPHAIFSQTSSSERSFEAPFAVDVRFVPPYPAPSLSSPAPDSICAPKVSEFSCALFACAWVIQERKRRELTKLLYARRRRIFLVKSTSLLGLSAVAAIRALTLFFSLSFSNMYSLPRSIK